MSFRGSAFLALWNGFDHRFLDEYECWHTFEHVPERLGVPGFLSARRYASGEGAGRCFFTLYEIEALEVLDSAAYQELVDLPTSWSAEMRRSFHGFRRFPCRRVASAGYGLSGELATFTFSLPAVEDEPDRLAALLNEQLCLGKITSFQIGVSIGRPQYKVFQQDFSSGEDTSTIVAVIEGTHARSLGGVGRMLAGLLPERFSTALDPRWESFDFLHGVTKPELLEARSLRLPPREDLRALFRAR
jgi:hypothetical protein